MQRLATAALVIALGTAPSAQNQFEVASVKKVTNNDGILTITFAPERFEILMPLLAIIQTAYDLRDFQVSGGPRWIYSDTYQIHAKAPGKASPAEMRAMLRTSRYWPRWENHRTGRDDGAARGAAHHFCRTARDG